MESSTLRKRSKVCPGCKKLRRLTTFVKSMSRPGGLGSYCRPCQRIKSRHYTAKDPEARRLYARIWAKKNRRRPRQHYSWYKSRAKFKSLSFSLVLEEFKVLIRQPCHYCGIPSTGLDRIDPKQGYRSDNVVSCCKRCNIAKNDQSYREFLDQCRRVVETHGS